MATLTKSKQAERDEAIQRLREMLKPGDEVYTSLTHVSSSGMTRGIKVLVPIVDEYSREGKPYIHDISYLVARAIPAPMHAKGGVKVGGCGMDMGFSLVYELGYCLFPEGFSLPEGKRGRNGDTSGYERDGGYALKHRWI